MARVKVVTAYVDLGLTLRPSGDFHALGRELFEAVRATRKASYRQFLNFPFAECLAEKNFATRTFPAANPRAEDRFVNEAEHVRSNAVQHSPIQWLTMAAAEDPHPEVFVWLGYSIMKQGAFTGRPVTPAAITRFLERVGKYPFGDIPIPSIHPDTPVNPFGDNWQFVGSTLVIPRKHLAAVDLSYKSELINFVFKYKAIPLDLAIWPAVVHHSGLPFRPYPAEYDATQLTNFP